LYDLGFPLVRSWLYGIGGFIVVTAAFAIGFVVANSGRPDTAEVEVPAAVVADESADDVIVVRAGAERPRFPAFAPEGVIVVPAPATEERAFAAAETVPHERSTVERATSERRAAERRARSNIRSPAPSPVAVAGPDSSAPRARELEQADLETSAEESHQDIRPTRNEAPPVREYEEAEYADNEASEEESDNRSWYGSEEYRREVAERRRAEREARRRRNGGS
jgi:hypothetical protein